MVAKIKANHIPPEPPKYAPIKTKKVVMTANKKPVFKVFTSIYYPHGIPNYFSRYISDGSLQQYSKS